MPLVIPPSYLSGPGALYYALTTATNPTFTATGGKFSATVFSGAAGWSSLGATEDGSELNQESTFEEIEAAEFSDPLDIIQTRNEFTISFNLVDFRASTLAKMQNGGVITTTGTSENVVSKVVAPASGSIIRCKIGFLSDDLTFAYVANRCVNVGGLGAAFRRAPDKAGLQGEFRVTQPTLITDPPLEPYFAGTARA